MLKSNRSIFIDPSYQVFNSDRLFDLTNPILNRDGQLLPYVRLRDYALEKGFSVSTADHLFKSQLQDNHQLDYYSMGILDNFPKLMNEKNVNLSGFLIMEPPAVAPHLYKALPKLTKHFQKVYLHNIIGDGYSLKNVDQSKLYTFYWPQPHQDVLEPYWNNDKRQNRIVVINGNHIPRSLKGQLYSKRIEAMASLAKIGIVDLYGRGWDQWWSHRSMWPPYWFNYKSLMSIYRGSCESKYEVLSNYKFSLCFENMAMSGYVTEKLFDCLYAGTIPLYLGAKDIEKLIPPDIYIDCRRFSSWEEMSDKVMSMPDSEILEMKEAGRKFIQSEMGMKYYNSLIDIINM